MPSRSACRQHKDDSPYPSDWSRVQKSTRAWPALAPLKTSPEVQENVYGSQNIWAKPLPLIIQLRRPVASASDVRKFKQLAAQWENETSMLSSLSDIITHRAYLKIIGMGPIAIPLILKEMKREHGHWFCALDALTDIKSPAMNCKKLSEATKAWIAWGEQKGYLEKDTK